MLNGKFALLNFLVSIFLCLLSGGKKLMSHIPNPNRSPSVWLIWIMTLCFSPKAVLNHLCFYNWIFHWSIQPFLPNHHILIVVWLWKNVFPEMHYAKQSRNDNSSSQHGWLRYRGSASHHLCYMSRRLKMSGHSSVAKVLKTADEISNAKQSGPLKFLHASWHFLFTSWACRPILAARRLWSQPWNSIPL